MIKVENQKNPGANTLETNLQDVISGNLQTHPVSPVSETLGFHIQTGAHSLSSDTD